MLTALALSLVLGSETLAPFQETMILGTGDSGGNLASWAADDGDRRTICKFYGPNIPHPFCRLHLVFRLGTIVQPKTMEIRVKVAGHTPGLQDLCLWMQNATAIFEQSSVFDTRIVDGTTYVATMPNPPGHYVSASGTLRLLVEVWRRGPSTSISPCVSFEYANLVMGD